MLYAEFQNCTDGNIDFKDPEHNEIFDLKHDPWQMKNRGGLHVARLQGRQLPVMR